MALADTGDGRHDLARRAVAALKGVVLDEGRLHGMKGASRCQALDGGDILAFGHHGEGEARERPASVDVHRTGAAFATIAALLGSGETEALAQRVEQRRPRINLQPIRSAVDTQLCRDRVGGRWRSQVERTHAGLHSLVDDRSLSAVRIDTPLAERLNVGQILPRVSYGW